jgi:hypothetical protein
VARTAGGGLPSKRGVIPKQVEEAEKEEEEENKQQQQMARIIY